MSNSNKIFNMVPLRGVTLFPGMTLHFDVGRPSSLHALRNANGKEIFFVAQKDIMVEKPDADDLYPVGVVGVVRQIVKLSDGPAAMRVVVEGKYRATIDEFVAKKLYYRVKISELEDDFTPPEEFRDKQPLLDAAAIFTLKNHFEE